MKNILKYIITFICMIIILLLMLIVVSYIPNKYIYDNIKESAETLYEEGEEKYTPAIFKGLYSHNSTDAIMLNVTYSIDNSHIFDSVMKARRNYNPGITTKIYVDENGDLEHNDKYDNKFKMTNELKDTVDKENIISYEYARYWHGYIVLLRPLLIIFNFTAIKMVFSLIFLIFLGLLLYLVYKETNIKTSLIILISFIAMDMFSWFTTFQGMLVMLLAAITSVFVANKKIKDNNIAFILFIVGGLTSYFDFLTTPLVTYLLPMVIFNIINYDENETYKSIFIRLIKTITLWGIGYFCIWMAKWIIVDISLGTNIIGLSITQVFYRMFAKIGKPSASQPYNSILLNYMFSFNILNIILYLVIFYKIIRSILKGCWESLLTKKKLIYYILGMMPVAWIIVISNHSYLHYHFTYKLLTITLMCLLLMCFEPEINKIEKKKE